ncbi:MAG: hypothetical protein F6J89_11325 [Symploca sp. SIO1C4]|uniref:Uncharacterized protein n=1 Tax=Symploca sp. SIO1C4 TaxID=2607765 RepID=A0A6B3NB84_9CYAN|nr:hypothetical protein [Symploca sp. SIO1C4]
MKTLKYWMLIPAAFSALLISTGVAHSQAVPIQPGFNDPLVLQGTSGGSNDSGDCGMINATANHTITLSQQFDYLRFTVEASGKPTLLIEGPNRRTCVPGLPDENIEDSGLWKPGKYSIFIGDSAGGQHNYKLSITQNRRQP